jgi:hypothetical protein
MVDLETHAATTALEPCRGCGAPVAADQRYCLACGERHTAARLPFLDILREREGDGVATAPAASPAPTSLRSNIPLLALLGVLGIAMLIGVLVGHWAQNDTPVARQSPPQVITVGGSGPAAAAPAATTGRSGGGTKGHKKAAAHHASAAPKAKNKALSSIQNLSGKAYQKQVDKLGKTISTGGKPPPKDNKPPAAGGGFQDIG